MKRIALKPWQLYVLMFILLYGINLLLRFIDPKNDWETGADMLYSCLTALPLTAALIAGDRVRRKNKKYKDKVEELLKNDE